MSSLADLERSFSLALSPVQKTGLRVYLELLQKWNRRLNLTGRQNTCQYLQFHFFEAFWAAQQFLAPPSRVADIGSGAGFPGLAMKLYCPRLDLTLIEKSVKKATFLRQAAASLGLDVEVVQGRAEEYSGWAGADLAALRALRPSALLLQTLARFDLKLLCFHGSEMDPGLDRLQCLDRKPVPQSRQRFVSLLQCGV